MAKSDTTLGHVFDMVAKAHGILGKVVGGTEGTPDTPTISSYAEDIRNRTEEISALKEQMGWDVGSFPKTKKVKMETRGKEYSAPQYTLPESGGQIAMLVELNKVLAKAAYEEAYPKGVKGKKSELTPKQMGQIKKHADALKVILGEMETMRKGKDHPYSNYRIRGKSKS